LFVSPSLTILFASAGNFSSLLGTLLLCDNEKHVNSFSRRICHALTPNISLIVSGSIAKPEGYSKLTSPGSWASNIPV
jgi:hypothetical protein